MGTSFTVQPARTSDAPEVAGLLADLGFPVAPETVIRRLEELARIGETVLVGTRGAAVLGVITVHLTPVLHRPTPVGRVTMLVVAAEARRQGLGRALMAAAEELLAAAGCGLIEVTSNRALLEAHAFYERLGYEPTSVRFRKLLPTSQKAQPT